MDYILAMFSKRGVDGKDGKNMENECDRSEGKSFFAEGKQEKRVFTAICIKFPPEDDFHARTSKGKTGKEKEMKK